MSERPPVKDWATDFDHLNPQWISDPFPIWDELRKTCPIAHTDRFMGVYLPTHLHMSKGVALNGLTLEAYQAHSALFEADVLKIDVWESLRSRDVVGGTSPRRRGAARPRPGWVRRRGCRQLGLSRFALCRRASRCQGRDAAATVTPLSSVSARHGIPAGNRGSPRTPRTVVRHAARGCTARRAPGQ